MDIDNTGNALFALLRTYSGEQVFNPWAERNIADDGPGNGPEARCQRLGAHLNINAAQLLLGEATGYQGCRISGIPFTSEKLIIAGKIPRLGQQGVRLSRRALPWSEPSATIVWSALRDFGIAHTTILWNAFPWHPYRADNALSNRTPNRRERADGLAVLEILLRTFPYATVFAVGRHAEQALQDMGQAAVALRHPSMGGATKFRQALESALKTAAKRGPGAMASSQ